MAKPLAFGRSRSVAKAVREESIEICIQTELSWYVSGPGFSGRISAEGGGVAACALDGEGGTREQYSLAVDHKGGSRLDYSKDG
jgi:hypothetical protein